jgi:hypothetical protein
VFRYARGHDEIQVGSLSPKAVSLTDRHFREVGRRSGRRRPLPRHRRKDRFSAQTQQKLARESLLASAGSGGDWERKCAFRRRDSATLEVEVPAAPALAARERGRFSHIDPLVLVGGPPPPQSHPLTTLGRERDVRYANTKVLLPKSCNRGGVRIVTAM